MYLIIDNSQNDQAVFYTSLNTKLVHHSIERKDRGLLDLINDLLKQLKLSLNDLQGIAVLIGVGKFTSTRVATTIANTLGLALKIPVLGIEVVDDNIIKQLQQTPVGIYISAQYSAPANIGVKK